LSYVWILSGIILAITGWSQVYQIRDLLLPTTFQIALCFYAVLFTWIAVLGIYGVTAASLKRPGLVQGYLLLLGLHLLLSFVGGTYYLVMSYRSLSDSALETCTFHQHHNPTVMQLCHSPFALSPGTGVVVYIASWMLELYACWMVFSYLQTLKEDEVTPDVERKLQRRAVTPESIGAPVPIPDYKPENIIPEDMMSSHGYPISIIFDTQRQSSAGSVQQHTWDGIPMPPPLPPPRPASPPTTPVTPSRPDLTTGIKPLMLTKKGAFSQPHTPQTSIDITTLPPYGPASPAYEVSDSGNPFGSPATTPTQAAYMHGSTDGRF